MNASHPINSCAAHDAFCLNVCLKEEYLLSIWSYLPWYRIQVFPCCNGHCCGFWWLSQKWQTVKDDRHYSNRTVFTVHDYRDCITDVDICVSACVYLRSGQVKHDSHKMSVVLMGGGSWARQAKNCRGILHFVFLQFSVNMYKWM